MQAVRGLAFPSKTSASLRCSNSKRVFTEISNVVHGSNIHWRGRSFAASVPSDSSIPQGGQKRVSKNERRAMIEAFVDKYRASNAGKYPTPTTARKQVGGSYYIVKKILQELEYNNQRSATSTSKRDEGSFEKEVPKEECLPSLGTRVVSSCGTRTDLTPSEPSLGLKDDSHTVVNHNLHTDEATSNTFQAKEGDLGSNENPLFEEALNPRTTGDYFNSDGTHSQQIKLENKEVSHLCIENPENSEKKAATSESSLDLNEGKVVVEAGQEASESNNLEKDIQKENEEDQSLKTSTVWGNLRSFADGIINLWRKM